MSNFAIQDMAGIISATVAAAPGADDSSLRRFVYEFYAGSPPDDLKNRSPQTLLTAARDAWTLLQRRTPGTPSIHVAMPKPGATTTSVAEGRAVILIVNDDMPFLVDSVTAELERMEMPALLVIHPVLAVVRDVRGHLVDIRAVGDENESSDAKRTVHAESLMHIEISPDGRDRELGDRLRDNLLSVLSDVRLAVRDWQPMRRHAARFAADFDGPSPGITRGQAEEVADFLRWLHDDHYTFLGYRRFRLDRVKGGTTLHIEHDIGLGLLTKRHNVVFEGIQDGAPLPAQFAQFLTGSDILLIIKANQRSTVHRRVHYDVAVIKIFNDAGRVAGMHMFIGLFTADVYTNSPNFVPVLKHKIDRIRARVGFRRNSHDDKRLQNIMENLPRDELFESSDDYLLHMGLGILHLQERARTAVFLRLDKFERFASCLVFVPRDRYDTALRVAIGEILVKALDGRPSSFYTQVTDSPLARLHYIIATVPGKVPHIDERAVEAMIARAARGWSDDLRDALISAHGEAEGGRLFLTFAHAFPAAYREQFPAATALADITRVLMSLDAGRIGISVYRPAGAEERRVNIKLYSPGAPLTLSDVIPVLEHMGFRVQGEEPFRIATVGGAGKALWLHDFEMTVATGNPIDPAKVGGGIEEAFRRVWADEMESDGFNKLVALADLAWREVTILRAYAKWLRQAAFPFSQTYIEDAFTAHPQMARLLVDLFLALFDPALNTAAKVKATASRIAEIRAGIDAALDRVTNADEDRILRRYLNLVNCSLRTNFFQKGAGGSSKPYLSIKLNSREIEDLPLPRPMVEVFVYSPRVEAIHLRGGKVARGGIRWSDRREDFRAEILGLVKAQMVKNAVIVPTGSKGGFVLKRPPAGGGREALQAEGIACYQILQRGLLDITDNIVKGTVAPPKDVVRKDGDDPYLVVAADKGTATFSDIANAVSAEYGFWLDDAYASGGSAGYDHKVMGITARGAWESVKRHFRETGMDCQAQDFTCVGIGDMSGDVFGNGMLMSPHTRLVAAFNHLHIFIDPTPDVTKSYAERARLFKLERSGWNDYNPKFISKGGGVFARSAKTIKLSAEMKALLDLTKAEATPQEIMNAILKVPADLLFFGGIGTYVKSSAESHADASDRANDGIRVNGREIRARIIGEGANLGMTQRGRIEAAMAGARLNTDAIDNSAGVDCSDHEVNIKILLNAQVAAGKLGLPARNKLLVEMTDDVAHLVLRDNYQQTQTISMLQRRAPELLEGQARTMKVMEREGLLNRAIEYLPSDEQIDERIAKAQGLTRPEIAVLLPYGKIWLYDKLVASDLPDDPLAEQDLVNYFPGALRKSYLAGIKNHKLRCEIISTVIANSFINRVGPSFLTTLMDRTGLDAVDVARAYTVTRAAYGLPALWASVEALDNKVAAATQMDMLLEINRMVERSVLWMLRHLPAPMDMAATIATLKPGVDAIRKDFAAVASAEAKTYVARTADAYQKQGVPAALAHDVASIYRLAAANDVTAIAAAIKQTVPQVAKLYFLIGDRFGLGALRARTEGVARGSHWDKLAISAAIEELFSHQRTLTEEVIAAAGKAMTGPKALQTWIDAHKARVDRYDQVLTEIKAAQSPNLAMLTVANRQLSAMTS